MHGSPLIAPEVGFAGRLGGSTGLAGWLCRYDKFAFDITEALESGVSGVHELAVRVFDPTGQPCWL